MRLVCSALLLTALLTTLALAADWPQWRGPQRDGISQETGLLQEWSEDGPPQVWKVKGLGKGYSSVAVSEGRIFSMGSIGGRESMVALNAKTGREMWTTPFGSGGSPNCSPTVDGDRVYGLGREGDLVCMSTRNGRILWQKNFKQDFGGSMMSGWGYSESPLIDGQRLICTPGAKDAAIAALDKKTGELIWTAPIPEIGNRGKDGAGYSSIVAAEVGGVRQYIQLMGRGVIAVAADDGRFLWSYNRIANGTANIPTPIVKDDHVFCSSGYGTGAALLKLTASGKNVDAQEVYFLDAKTLQNHHGGMVLQGDYIYCGHGHNNGFPKCIHMMTGEVVWDGGRGPGSGSAAIILADGNLYFRYQDNVMALIQATPEKYNLRGTFEFPGRGQSWPHPVISNGRLYLRAQDELFCYNVAKR